MGVIDKLKNALFEVEYVEVDDVPEKEKKSKHKEKTKHSKNIDLNSDDMIIPNNVKVTCSKCGYVMAGGNNRCPKCGTVLEEVEVEKPVAKKVVLPGKRNEKVNEIKEEELKDDNFEVRPKTDLVKEEPHRESFKFMDDNDFKVDDDLGTMDSDKIEVPKMEYTEPIITREKKYEDKYEEEVVEEKEPEKVEVSDISETVEKINNDLSDVYGTAKPDVEVKPYGMDKTYNLPVHEYGTYDKKEEKSYFKPSPIISPIYGILDKNYKKEDVVQKKEIRLTSSYSRSNVSVDEIRDKAYGETVKEEKIYTNPLHEEIKIEEEEEKENLLVDLTDEKEKPEVKEVTMGDALEYFNDLGLEYNVDYVDASKEKTPQKREKSNYDDIVSKVDEEPNKMTNTLEDDISNTLSDIKINPEKIERLPSKESETEEKNNEIVEDSIKEEVDDDNLFDLIDSMYKEKD